jgi:hypothetical protein
MNEGRKERKMERTLMVVVVVEVVRGVASMWRDEGSPERKG